MKRFNQSISVFITMALVMSRLFNLGVCKEVKVRDLKTGREKNEIICLTEKIDTNIYKRIAYNSEDFELEQEEKKKEIESKILEGDNLIKINISQEIIHVLRVNWELGNENLKTHIHWVLLLLILKVDKYKERPKGMRQLDDYNDCLYFIKNNHKSLLKSNLVREEKIQSTQRACIAFFDNLFKIKSKWSSISSEDYLQLSKRITSSQLYVRWMELFKVDPPRSQWLILRKLAINQFDEILRLLKILTKNTNEYKSLENILIEFMTQFNSYCKDFELNDKLCKEEMRKYLKDDYSIGFKDKAKMIELVFKDKTKRKNRRNFRIYLPEEMPDLYVYHHQVNTCVLNLSIMSLYPELKIFFYDVFKRKPTYYLFHRKPITISRKTLLRSNQLCNLMLELTNRLERSYYLLYVKQNKFVHYQDTDVVEKTNPNKLFIDHFGLSEYILRKGLIKPLPFHPYYYSNPSDVEIQTIFIDWFFNSHFEMQSLIDSLKSYTKDMEKKHKDLFLNARLDLLKKLISEDEQMLRADISKEEKKLKDGLFLLYFQKRANKLKSNTENVIKHLNSVKNSMFIDGKLSEFIELENSSPNVFSLIPMIYLNSKLWNVQKFLYKYPVSVKVSLKKLVKLSETLKIGEKRLGDIKVGDISTCIKVTTIFWKNYGIKLNNRSFRIINPDNLSEFYEKNNELSEVYMDYATIYLLCVKSVSQSLIYYKRMIKYYLGDEFDNYWKLNMLLDMNNEDSSNSFQYINKKNINLHSLPNDFIMPNLTRGAYISILSAYLLLTVGAICIQSLITIIF
ncbi:membrane associated plus transmembrane domain or GPI anchor at C-terminus [Cryptosporidium sp. chipmunk genotype I]|uniref:membrane associated plus transmembrane domain or GPI anchor at C-terminus n=1 Tax=Cryptosporidium sp. chipmunk genotype I TaxID=1280935 RepID=UPI00351A3316|nr:membrane associated plus transmembrane domain or GPI anchor at C-terminus [Cryptosporidium sp. chipmunk genotype I]